MMENINGAKIIGGNGERIDSDFYPTPKDVTIALMEFLDKHGYINYMLSEKNNVLEPCCGDGAISKVLIEYGFLVESNDIRFTEFQDRQIDYFFREFKRDVIITNPPFSMAEDFIKKALKETDYLVAMLLKTQYWHASKRIKLFTDHPPAYILPLTWRPNFFGDKATGSPTMDFLSTVWIKGETDTKYRSLKKPDQSFYESNNPL